MLKILVIDDEPQIRKFLRISLTASGYKVVEAETGTQGAEAAGTGAARPRDPGLGPARP